jgi:general secretion pathway protein G
MRCTRRPGRGGFSLVELVIVVVILAILAAIALPRISHASHNSGEAVLRADLKALRQAIDMYAVEHRGDRPGQRSAGTGANVQTSECFDRQLTWYTTQKGDALQARDATHVFGPYLERIPKLPVGSRAGQHRVFSTNAFSAPGAPGKDYGWEYEHYFGRIRANCPATEVGANGVPYANW